MGKNILWILLFAFGLLGGENLQAQGILGRQNLANLKVTSLKASDMAPLNTGSSINAIQQRQLAEKLQAQLAQKESFEAVRSRLPEMVLRDSLEMKNFVKKNIFRDTLIYGSELFRNSTLDIAPNIQLANAPTYVLGSGDQLDIVIFGMQEAAYVTEVKPNGTVVIPYVGSVQASGLSVAAFTSKLRQRLSAVGYKGISSGETKVEVAVTEVRTVQVTVLGAKNPGSYSVPSVATVYHVLYAAGGPGESGSYREIELIREGKIIEVIDLYALLATGIIEKNVNVEEGDVIRIPVYKNRINLMGEFKRSGLFEVLEGESVASMLDHAGGFNEGAYKGQLIVFSTGEYELKMGDVSAEDYPTIMPAGGDVFMALPLRNRYENRVSVTGGVVRPGNYGFEDGLTMQMLLQRAQGLDRTAITGKAILIRRPDAELASYIPFDPRLDDPLLEANDSIYIGLQRDLWSFDSVLIRGFVVKPGKYSYYPGITAEQLIILAGGITSEGDLNNVEVSLPQKDEKGQNTGVQSTIIADLNFKEVGLTLNGGATVSVRRRRNMDVFNLVYLKGAVVSQGGYSLREKGEPLKYVLERSGGFSPNAMPELAIVVRKNTGLVPKESPLFRRTQWISAQDSSKIMERYDPIATRQLDTIAIDLTSPQTLKRFTLLHNDTVIVPTRDNVVFVRGAVKNAGGHTYVPGKRMKYYLSEAGGLKSSAKLRDVAVVDVNGRSREVKFLLGIWPVYPRVYSNAEIICPKQEVREQSVDPMKLSAVASALASTSSMLLGIVYLLRP